MASKPKCKYWDACYRTAPAHLAAYAHPPKTATTTKKRPPTGHDSDVPPKRARADDSAVPPRLSRAKSREAEADKPNLSRDKSRDKDTGSDKPALTRRKSREKPKPRATHHEDEDADHAPLVQQREEKGKDAEPTTTCDTDSKAADPSQKSTCSDSLVDDLLPISPVPPHPFPRLHRMSHIDSVSSSARTALWRTELATLYSMPMPDDLVQLWECALRYGMEHGATVPVEDEPDDAKQKHEQYEPTSTTAHSNTADTGDVAVPESSTTITETDTFAPSHTSTDDTSTFASASTDASSTSSATPFLAPTSSPYTSPATPFLSLLSRAGLSLCGPYDIMSGQWAHRDASRVNIHLHYRYWYDPPEMMTVLRAVSDDPDHEDVKHAVHYGYWRDDPSDVPSFLVHSAPGDHNNDRTRVTELSRAQLTPAGSTMHTCIIHHIKSRMKSASTTMRKSMQQVLDVIEKDAKQYGYEMNKVPNKEKVWSTRHKKLIATTLNSIGLIVPVVNDIGYRPLPLNEKELIKLLQSMDKQQIHKGKMDYTELDNINNLISYANDECDPGMGLEMGIALFCATPALQNEALRTLSLAYQLLSRPVFQSVIEAHLRHRHIASSPALSQLR